MDIWEIPWEYTWLSGNLRQLWKITILDQHLMYNWAAFHFNLKSPDGNNYKKQ